MKVSVAPMMDYTDRHDRYFLRLIAPDVLLYTEMITAAAILHGDRAYLLGYDPLEHPVALQLGGCDPSMLSKAAEIGAAFGYDEINLNLGCPSPRVSSGRFGACLMLEPTLTAECVAAMRVKVNVPVTVKCRIGVDHHDSYEALCSFIETVKSAGCNTFIIHARKAWLKGLSPKQNREVPLLRYDVVRQVKQDFPELNIILNGGIKTVDQVVEHLTWADGVMIGREAYSNPYLLAHLQSVVFDKQPLMSRQAIIEKFIPYVEREIANGTKLSAMTRHIPGLFHGISGASQWRRYLSENAHRQGAGVEVIRDALLAVA